MVQRSEGGVVADLEYLITIRSLCSRPSLREAFNLPHPPVPGEGEGVAGGEGGGVVGEGERPESAVL